MTLTVIATENVTGSESAIIRRMETKRMLLKPYYRYQKWRGGATVQIRKFKKGKNKKLIYKNKTVEEKKQKKVVLNAGATRNTTS